MLGAACGKRSFVDGYVVDKIKEWEEEIDMLSKIAEMYPHAAYTAFTRAIMGKWKYLMRTIDGIGNMLQPLEKAISAKFIPALTGRGPCSSVERAIIPCQFVTVDSTLLILLMSRIFIIRHH